MCVCVCVCVCVCLCVMSVCLCLCVSRLQEQYGDEDQDGPVWPLRKGHHAFNVIPGLVKELVFICYWW